MRGIATGDSNSQGRISQVIDICRVRNFSFDRSLTPFAFEDIEEACGAALSGRVVEPVVLMTTDVPSER